MHLASLAFTVYRS